MNYLYDRVRIHRTYNFFNLNGAEKNNECIEYCPPQSSAFFPFPSTPGLGGTFLNTKKGLVESFYIIKRYKKELEKFVFIWHNLSELELVLPKKR